MPRAAYFFAGPRRARNSATTRESSALFSASRRRAYICARRDDDPAGASPAAASSALPRRRRAGRSCMILLIVATSGLIRADVAGRRPDAGEQPGVDELGVICDARADLHEGPGPRRSDAILRGWTWTLKEFELLFGVMSDIFFPVTSPRIAVPFDAFARLQRLSTVFHAFYGSNNDPLYDATDRAAHCTIFPSRMRLSMDRISNRGNRLRRNAALTEAAISRAIVVVPCFECPGRSA